MSNETPFERPSLTRWLAWLLAAIAVLTALMGVLLMQLEPEIREALLSQWFADFQGPVMLSRYLVVGFLVSLFGIWWYGLRFFMARDDLEDNPRVREPFKDRFVRGDLEPEMKVVCTECGDVHEAMQIDCPECGSTEIERASGN